MSKLTRALGFTEEELIEEGIQLNPQEEQEFLKREQEAQKEQDSVQEVSASANELHESARNSLDFLSALAMPTIFKFFFPPVFISAWNWLTQFAQKTRDFSQLVLGLPRGFGKSTVVKLFVLFCILFTKKKFILIIAARAELAENILSDIIDMLNEPNIQAVFGDWRLGIEKDTQGIKKFGFRGRNIILAGLGSGTSLRGLNLKNERPDVMIFDDVQTRECADSTVESTKLLQWMIGTAMKAKSPMGCLYLFVGNMYPTKNSILKQLKTNPEWVKFIAGGILADGTSLWEELQPITQLLREYKSDLAMGHPEIFFSEVLNDENASANNLIDLSKIPAYPYQADDISAGSFIIIDPSNDKINSDAVAIGYFEVHDAKPVMMEVMEDLMSPGTMITNALKIALRTGCRLIAVESNAYQYSTLYWFGVICEQYQITGIQIVDLYSGSMNKNSRILQMLKAYAAQEIIVHPECKAQVHSQITAFNPMKRDNTDGILDLLTYAPKTIELYGHFIISTNIIEEQEYAGARALTTLENSSF